MRDYGAKNQLESAMVSDDGSSESEPDFWWLSGTCVIHYYLNLWAKADKSHACKRKLYCSVDPANVGVVCISPCCLLKNCIVMVV